jgi:hypothetical protein
VVALPTNGNTENQCNAALGFGFAPAVFMSIIPATYTEAEIDISVLTIMLGQNISAKPYIMNIQPIVLSPVER